MKMSVWMIYGCLTWRLINIKSYLMLVMFQPSEMDIQWTFTIRDSMYLEVFMILHGSWMIFIFLTLQKNNGWHYSKTLHEESKRILALIIKKKKASRRKEIRKRIGMNQLEAAWINQIRVCTLHRLTHPHLKTSPLAIIINKKMGNKNTQQIC